MLSLKWVSFLHLPPAHSFAILSSPYSGDVMQASRSCGEKMEQTLSTPKNRSVRIHHLCKTTWEIFHEFRNIPPKSQRMLLQLQGWPSVLFTFWGQVHCENTGAAVRKETWSNPSAASLRTNQTHMKELKYPWRIIYILLCNTYIFYVKWDVLYIEGFCSFIPFQAVKSMIPWQQSHVRFAQHLHGSARVWQSLSKSVLSDSISRVRGRFPTQPQTILKYQHGVQEFCSVPTLSSQR